MPDKKQIAIPSEKLILFDKLIATIPEIERKGVTNPYTSYNGHMFTHLSPEGTLAIRLPEKELEAFIKKYKTRLNVAHGVVQKEYAEVPDSLFKKTNDLKHYLAISFEYVKTLKPKPTTKSKK